MVKPGNYGTTYNHYSLVRTLSDMYGLTPPGAAANVGPIAEVWRYPAGVSPAKAKKIAPLTVRTCGKERAAGGCKARRAPD